ncbi:MAG: ammonium transporter, partial [Verrucomicrobiota bacterium]
FDKIKIDDPVGAISVHGVCGIWGTLAVAIFQQEGAEINFMWQLIGTLSISAFAFIFCLIFAIIVKVIMGLRVSEDEEVEGLDIGEHGQEAYPDFAPSIKG